MCATAFAWGDGSFGRLGLGEDGEGFVNCPIPVGRALKGCELYASSAGLFHSAVVTAAGEVFVWGVGSGGDSGEGWEDEEGEPGLSPTRAKQQSADSPSRSPNRSPIRRRDSTPFIPEQELPPRPPPDLPRRVDGFPTNVRIVQVACGGDLTGAFTIALSSDGVLFSWGMRSACGLGGEAGTRSIVAEPTPIRRFLTAHTKSAPAPFFVSISAGGASSAAIAADGSIYTWGDGSNGRLGLGPGVGQIQWRPKRVESLVGEDVRGVEVGGSHCLAISRNGILWAWGGNEAGQLGLGDLGERWSPKIVPHPTGSLAWGGISAGVRHSLAFDSQGRVFVWGGFGGRALGGALGGRKGGDWDIAVLGGVGIPGGVSKLEFSWVRPRPLVALEGWRACKISGGSGGGVVVTSEGMCFQWGGQQEEDQLGEGSIGVPRIIPAPLLSLEAFKAGPSHVVGLGVFSNHSLRLFANDLAIDGDIDKEPIGMSDRQSHRLTRVCLHSNEGVKIFVNEQILRLRVGEVVWDQVVISQLSFIDETALLEKEDSLSAVTKMVDNMRNSKTAKKGVTWGSENNLPAGAMFSSYNSQVLKAFCYFLYTDRLPVITEGDLVSLARLGVCLGFGSRLLKLIDSRLLIIRGGSRFALQVPPTSEMALALDNMRIGSEVPFDVKVHCANSEDHVDCHSFLFYDIPELLIKSSGKLFEIRAVASHSKHIVRLLIDWLYIESLPPCSMETLIDALTAAQKLGLRSMIASLEDELVSRVNDTTWLPLLSVAVNQPSVSCPCLKEACLAHIGRPLFETSLVEMDKLNEAKAITWTRSDNSVRLVDSCLQAAVGAKLDGLRRRWPKLHSELLGSLSCELMATYNAKQLVMAFARQLTGEDNNKWFGVTKEINNEPSLINTSRDLILAAIVIGIVAVISKGFTYTEVIAEYLPVYLKGYLTGTSGLIVLVILNFVVVGLIVRAIGKSLADE